MFSKFFRRRFCIKDLQNRLDRVVVRVDARERDLDIVHAKRVKLEQALKTSRELCDVLREDNTKLRVDGEVLTKELSFAREEFRGHSEGLKEILNVIHGCDTTLLIEHVEGH
jgi:hypothetical protein